MDDIQPDGEDEALGVEDQGDEHAALHEEALQLFDATVQPVQEERALALRDRRFATIAGAQWEGAWGEQFENAIMVEINKVATGLEKIIGDYRSNRLEAAFRAADDSADKDTGELLGGMFRADLDACAGMDAVDNAFEEGVQGGYGAFRLGNNFEDEYDPENDYQRIRFLLIPDADQSVFWDPNAKSYDKSDAKFCFVLTAISRHTFEEDYPDAATSWPVGLVKTYYEWYRPDVIVVAEHYEVREQKGKLYVLRNKATGDEERRWAADLDDGELADLKQQGWELVRTRQGKRKQIWKTLLSGSDVLKAPKRIAGCHIPVVPFYGKRWFVDGMERARGNVRLSVDSQRVRNALVSKMIETAAAAPTERPIFTPEQIAGHETSWAEANLKRAPYALINPMLGQDGNPLPAGPIGKIEPPQLPPVIAALIEIASSDIAELTTADDGADEVRANVSAEAMDLAATRTDDKSAIYKDNLKKTWKRAAEIYKSMAEDVYVEEGRSVPTLSADGKEHGHATLLEAYADENGFRVRHDISRGKYEVVADVTEATTTRRDKTVKTLVGAAQIAATVDPQLAAACINTAMMNMDGEGMHDLQDWLRQRGIQQGFVKPTDQEAQDLAKKAQAQAQNQQPDPAAQLAQAQTAKAGAETQKALAQTEQAKAGAIKSMADAQALVADSQHSTAERRMGLLERFHAMLHPTPANQAPSK